ncbi:MAG: hypothetical protein AB1505_35615 [Candidatus Latescibacterota bacterium]
MSTAAKQAVLRSFDLLPEHEKQEVAAEIIRRAVQLHLVPLADEELVSLAEELFLELDERESQA